VTVAPLHVVGGGGAVDLDAATVAVHDLLVALGQEPGSDDLAETPRRVATALAELLTPRPFTMTTFANDGSYDEMVVVRDIAFHFPVRAPHASVPGRRARRLSP
jgi:GTP cyclohydrolase IA